MGHGAPTWWSLPLVVAAAWGWLVLAPAVVVGVEGVELAERALEGARAWRAGLRRVVA